MQIRIGVKKLWPISSSSSNSHYCCCEKHHGWWQVQRSNGCWSSHQVGDSKHPTQLSGLSSDQWCGSALLLPLLQPKKHSSISHFLSSPDGLIDCFFLLLNRSARKPEMQALDLSVCCFPHVVVVFYLSVCLHVGKRIVRPYFFEFLAHVRGFFKLAPLQSSLSIQALPTVSFFFLLWDCCRSFWYTWRTKVFWWVMGVGSYWISWECFVLLWLLHIHTHIHIHAGEEEMGWEDNRGSFCRWIQTKTSWVLCMCRFLPSLEQPSSSSPSVCLLCAFWKNPTSPCMASLSIKEEGEERLSCWHCRGNDDDNDVRCKQLSAGASELMGRLWVRHTLYMILKN